MISDWTRVSQQFQNQFYGKPYFGMSSVFFIITLKLIYIPIFEIKISKKILKTK